MGTLIVDYILRKGGSRKAPYVEIAIRVNATRTTSMMAMVDSGSAMTCIPRLYLSQIPHCPNKPVLVEDVAGVHRKYLSYFAEVILYKDGKSWCSCAPPGGILFGDGDIAVLGRDVLDRFILTLDGKTCQFVEK